MKKTLISFVFCAFALISCNGNAQDFTVNCWEGESDGGKVVIDIARRASDGLVAGKMSIGEYSYTIVGDPAWQSDDEVVVSIYNGSLHTADLEGTITPEGGLDCYFTRTEYQEDLEFSLSGAVSQLSNPFVHPTKSELEPFSLYDDYWTFRESDMMYYRKMILVNDENPGLSFNCTGETVEGFGTVNDIFEGDWNNIPYEDGKIIVKDGDDALTIEVFKDFIWARHSSTADQVESQAAAVQGFYFLSDSGAEVSEEWYYDPYYDDYEDTPYYLPAAWFADVKAMCDLLTDYTIGKFQIPVKVAGSKPGVEDYFRALAKAFPGGVLGETLKCLDRQESGAKVTVDARNGYMSSSVPRTEGGEGMEMCYWRGAEGQDVVALDFIYDGCAFGDEDYTVERWFTIFFRYDPKSAVLKTISSTGSEAWCLWYPDSKYDMTSFFGFWQVSDVKLPRIGKTIEFLNSASECVYECEWSAEIQWFIDKG